MFQRKFRSQSQIHPSLLAGILATALSVPALMGQSAPFPTYKLGENQNALHGPTFPETLKNPWVISNGQIITPAGNQVYLGIQTRAKAVALNPNANTHTAAVLQMGAPQVISIFSTQTGAVVQTYNPPYLSGTSIQFDSDGSNTGITYTPDGLHLLFSQDGSYGPTSYVTIASVDPNTGLITSTGGSNAYPTQVAVPADLNSANLLTTVTCFPSSPPGTTGSSAIPCGQPVANAEYGSTSSYPLGIAVTPDGKTAYAVLDVNDTLTKIDLTAATPTEGPEVRVGNVPNSVVISPDGTTAYVSNEAGRIALMGDFQEFSGGTPVFAAYPNGGTATGSVSVVDLFNFTVTN